VPHHPSPQLRIQFCAGRFVCRKPPIGFLRQPVASCFERVENPIIVVGGFRLAEMVPDQGREVAFELSLVGMAAERRPGTNADA
jgi:hypothetical protein